MEISHPCCRPVCLQLSRICKFLSLANLWDALLLCLGSFESYSQFGMQAGIQSRSMHGYCDGPHLLLVVAFQSLQCVGIQALSCLFWQVFGYIDCRNSSRQVQWGAHLKGTSDAPYNGPFPVLHKQCRQRGGFPDLLPFARANHVYSRHSCSTFK